MDIKEQDFRSSTEDDVYSNGTANGNVDTAFRKINKNYATFLIWRVENMNIIALPREQYGTFNDNDSFIVYSASQYGQSSCVDTVPREIRSGQIEYHIHFWLGSSTSPDKSGVAAYKTVELDNVLNGVTTQHRETQGHESGRFMSYFKNGIRVLKPHLQIELSNLPKFYRVKGKRCPILTEMDDIAWTSFNSADIFLLHDSNNLFVWIGRASNTIEKMHASKIAKEMRKEHIIEKVIFVDDGYEKTMQEDAKKQFNRFLPLDKRHILPENETDNKQKIQCRSQIRLYKCTENGGKYRVAEIKSGPLHQADLNSEDVFIVDHENNGIWVWVGKRAMDKERTEALRNARGFVKKRKYPNYTKVARAVDGNEPNEFRMLFSSWKDENNKNNGKGTKPTVLVSKFDAMTMEERPNLAAEMQIIDDGTGSVTVWRIKQSNIVEVPRERHRYFFSGDCYIILYNYQTSTEDKHLLYYWLGSHAVQEDINSTTQKTSEIDAELGYLGFHARVIQGYEPAHFLQIFKGKLIVFRGKGTDFDDSGRNLKQPVQYCLQIFGSTKYTSKGIQVQPKSTSLNSNYCFVIKRGKHAHVWCGNHSTGDQREMAKGFAGKDFELVMEGKEKEDFFNILGGKTVYTTHLIRNEADPKPARLFFCCKASFGFKVEEIYSFNQSNLIPEDILLLDANETLYVWIGKLSTKENQRMSLQVAIEYLQSDPSDRDMNIPVIHIKQNHEPPTFTGFFPSWDKKFWKSYKSFGKLRQEIEGKQSNNNNNDHEKNGFSRHHKSGHSDFDQYDKYPLDILKEQNDKLPARVDSLNKEVHLTHDDFISVFHIPYSEFEKLPKWKQQEMKKKTGLF